MYGKNYIFATDGHPQASMWEDLRIDYCGFGPFKSTPINLMISISLPKVLICIMH